VKRPNIGDGSIVPQPAGYLQVLGCRGQLLSGPLADDVPVYEMRIEEDKV
jgi:hypothetical protein